MIIFPNLNGQVFFFQIFRGEGKKVDIKFLMIYFPILYNL